MVEVRSTAAAAEPSSEPYVASARKNHEIGKGSVSSTVSLPAAERALSRAAGCAVAPRASGSAEPGRDVVNCVQADAESRVRGPGAGSSNVVERCVSGRRGARRQRVSAVAGRRAARAPTAPRLGVLRRWRRPRSADDPVGPRSRISSRGDSAVERSARPSPSASIASGCVPWSRGSSAVPSRNSRRAACRVRCPRPTGEGSARRRSLRRPGTARGGWRRGLPRTSRRGRHPAGGRSGGGGLRKPETAPASGGESSYEPKSATSSGCPAKVSRIRREPSAWGRTSASTKTRMSPVARAAPALRAAAGPGSSARSTTTISSGGWSAFRIAAECIARVSAGRSLPGQPPTGASGDCRVKGDERRSPRSSRPRRRACRPDRRVRSRREGAGGRSSRPIRRGRRARQGRSSSTATGSTSAGTASSRSCLRSSACGKTCSARTC